jgi:hypothetical protein
MYLWDGTYDILTEADLKAMLVTSSYTPDRDDQYVDDGGANDPTDHEISGGSGYTGGFGGAGRKVLASKTITIDLVNDRSDFDCADITWSAIDTTTEPAYLIAIIEETADNDSPLISEHDFVAVTNGGDLTAQIADLIRLATV